MSIVHAQIETITVDARAKINLALHVTARRPDGYHLLDSLVVFADIADRISVRPKAGFSLSLSGPYSSSLADTPLDDNLVLRAGRAMGVALGRDDGAAITLEKNLPIASGIGGGSADAAATLVALQKLWGATPGPDALQAMALGLGADVPVCLAGRPRRMRGVGEILDPVPALPDLWIVLANPGISVSTPAVFRARAPSFSAPVLFPDRFSSAASLADWLRHATRNDLEAAALAICPQIGDVLSALAQAPGCLLARMSGSGATCFALHASSETAATAAAGLDARGWWARAGKLGT